LETEEQMLEREQNERDVLEALGEYKFSTGWAVGVVKSVERKKSVAASLHSSMSQKRIAGLKN
jgi:hypothetical protein